MEVQNIQWYDIEPSPMNPRKTFDEADLQELADNIRQQGLLQPITVRPKDEGKYEIVCGERRYRAWLKNIIAPKYPSAIPCIVKEMTDEEAFDAMITENLQRKDVDPMEEAFAFAQLQKTGKSAEEIALRFGKSPRFVQERIKLNTLIPELKKKVTDEWMSIGAATIIARLNEDDQRKFLDKVDRYLDDRFIIKQDAQDFVDQLFLLLSKAKWEDDYKGSCGVTCDKCPFNSANANCLFYEMKERPENAKCTDRNRFNKKSVSWLIDLVLKHADELVKKGEPLQPDKTLLVIDEEMINYANETTKAGLQQMIEAFGEFEVNRKPWDTFERWTKYNDDDERLQQKLDAGECYRVIVISANWSGINVEAKCMTFRTNDAGENAEVMKLVREYKEQDEKSYSKLSDARSKMLGVLKGEELDNSPLNETEILVLHALLLSHCSYDYRTAKKVSGTIDAVSELDFISLNQEERNRVLRDYIKTSLSGTGVYYSDSAKRCQDLILDLWMHDDAEKLKDDFETKKAKKQAKIEEKLKALGYDTEGKKLPF